MDRGVWWAAVHGVAKSWTRLKRLSTHRHSWGPLGFQDNSESITEAASGISGPNDLIGQLG